MADDLDKLFSDVPDASIDDLFKDLPETKQAKTLLGYTGQQIYDASQVPAEMVGGIAGGTLAAPAGPLGMVAGGALGTAAGNRVHKAIGQALGYAPSQSVGDVALDTGTAALRGATGEAGGQVASRIIGGTATKVGDILRNAIAGRARPDALADEAVTGISLTAAEASQNKSGLGVQNAMSALPGSKGVFASKYDEQLEQASRALDNAVDMLGGTRGISRDLAGLNVTNAYRSTVRDALNARSTQGRADFAITDAMMNERPYIRVDHFRQQIQEEVAKLSASTLPRNAARARQLNMVLNRINSRGPMMTGFEVNTHLSDFGKASTDGKLFARLDMDAADRAIAGRVADALDRDLGIAANNFGTMQGAVGSSLENARANWRTASQTIAGMRDSVLGRFFNSNSPIQPHQVYEKVMSLQGPELAQTTRLLDGFDPTVMNNVRTTYLEEIIGKASKSQSINSHGDIVDTLAPKKFSDIIDSKVNIHRFTTLFPGPVGDHIQATVRQLDRMSVAGRPSRWLQQVALGSSGALTIYPLLQGSFGQAATVAGISGGVYLTTRQLAKVLSVSEGRQALNILMNPNATPHVALRALSYLGAQSVQIDDIKEGAEAVGNEAIKAMPTKVEARPMNVMAGIRG